jgi:hypothetical protein
MGATSDGYTVTARIAPALLATAPAICLGLAALPLMPGVSKLWSLLGAAVTTFAALAARRAGNRVQPQLWERWGGAPTVRRLRYRDNSAASEITRRHREVERVLGGGLVLPSEADESSNPASADAEYGAAMRRLIDRVRGSPDFALLNTENHNYGFARNLYGLKRFGLICCAVILVVSVGMGVVLGQTQSWSNAAPLLAPALITIIAGILWRQVDPDFVRPSADAYADRLIETLDKL